MMDGEDDLGVGLDDEDFGTTDGGSRGGRTGKIRFLKFCPCPFLRPNFFSDLWRSWDLCPVLFSVWEFAIGEVCFIINALCVLIYTLVSTFESPPLDNAMVYKWISCMWALGWICAYPPLALAKYLTLYYGTTGKHMRTILWPVYMLLNIFTGLITFVMFWGGPSSVGVGQAFEYGLTKVTGFFVWAVFLLCLANCFFQLFFFATQLMMLFVVIVKFAIDICKLCGKKNKNQTQVHTMYVGNKEIEIEQEL